MNLNRLHEPVALSESSYGHRRSAWSRTVEDQIEAAKARVRAEFEAELNAYPRLLHLALNEAEALAWETSHPHLVFPTLAVEKAQAASDWSARQRVLLGGAAEQAFSA